MSTRTFYRKIFQNDLSPNQHYLLICISNKEKPRREACTHLHEDIRILRLKGYIDKHEEITSDGAKALKEIRKALREPEKNSPIVDTDNIQNYINLFPKKRLPSGKLARSSPKNLEPRFQWFFKNHDYTWEEVLLATKMYIKEYENKGYNYMRCSMYFIKKVDVSKTPESTLADYCQQVRDGVDIEEVTVYNKNTDTSFSSKAV